MKRFKLFVYLFVAMFLMLSSNSFALTDNAHKSYAVKDINELRVLLKSLQGKDSNVSTFIEVQPGTYTVTETIQINTSNLTIFARGVKLVLADGVNHPVIAIGSQEQTPTYTISNIYIVGVEMDGNKDKQTSELDSKKPWIRNNAIDVRSVTNLVLDNVICNNARSGGLVVSWNSSDIHINDSVFSNNYFDGVAYYTSKRIYTNSSLMLSNKNAGISIDNSLSDSVFANCIVDSNGDVGIFMRNALKIRFNGCIIQNSKSYAAFLSDDINSGTKGVADILFTGCHFLDNNGGINVSPSTGSTNAGNNSYGFVNVLGSAFRGNEQSGRTNLSGPANLLLQNGNILK